MNGQVAKVKIPVGNFLEYYIQKSAGIEYLVY
jgi:hypothetical protein